jgi:hypothetical protein
MRGDCHEAKFNFTVGVMDRSPSITIRPHFMPIFCSIYVREEGSLTFPVSWDTHEDRFGTNFNYSYSTTLP